MTFATRISLWLGGLLIAVVGLFSGLWYFGLPPLGLGGIQQSLLAEVARTLESDADRRAAEIVAGLEVRRGNILYAAETQALTRQLERGDPETRVGLEHIFDLLQRAYPDRYERVLIVDPANGRVRASSAPADLGRPFEAPGLIERARQPGMTELVEELSAAAGRPTLVIVRQIHALDADAAPTARLLGLLVAFLDSRSLLGEEFQEHSALSGRFGNAWLYGATGRLLAQSGDAPAGPPPFPTQAPVASGFSGTLPEWDAQGQEWLAVFRTIRFGGAQGWTLVRAASKAEALAAMTGDLNRLAAVGLLLALAALVLIGPVARRLTRPLRDLALAAERLGAGEWSARAEPGRGDSRETTVLAQAFNRMATNIQGARQTLEDQVSARTAELLAAQTRVRQVLAQVAKSETLYRTLFAQAPLGVVLTDPRTGRLCESNARFAEIVGRPLETLLRLDWMQLTHPDDLQPDLDNRARLIAGEISRYRMNKRYFRPDGTIVWINLTVAPVDLGPGEPPRHLAMIEDITERKAAEDRLHGITDTAHDGILMMNPQGEISYWNPAATAMLGYTAAEALGQNLHALLAPARFLGHHQMAFPEFQRSGHGPAVGKTIELSARCKDGQELMVELSLSAVSLQDGWNAVGILRDVSERKRMEAALSASEERYRLALEVTSEGLWDADMVTGIEVVNDQWYAQLGYEIGEVTPTYALWQGHLHPEDAPAVFGRIADYLEGRATAYRSEHRILTRSGAVRWHRSLGKVVARGADGAPIRIIGTNTDITEQVQAMARIREANEWLRLAMNAADIGIWNWDFSTNRLEWDERLCAWYEVPEATCQSGLYYDFWRSRVHPDDREQAEAKLRAAIRGNAPNEDEFRIVLPGGRVRYMHSASIIELGTNGKQVRMLGVNRDITAQREQEEDLRAAKQAADAANVAKSAFLAHMSHEIRTPLNSVLGLAQVLEKGALEPDQREMLQQIRAAGRSLLGILNDILDLSKIEAGQLQLERRPFALGPLLTQIETLLGAAARRKGLMLRIPPAPAALGGGLLGDPLRLEQVLVNLIGNAIKFTEQGEILVSIDALECTAETARLRFEVSDSGIGITPAAQERLFLPFAQADGSITRRFGGTGLGLSICKRLVELMGGRIGVRSQPGEGSAFWFELVLPRTTADEIPAEVEAPTMTTALPASGPRLTGVHFLVVDDSFMNRDLVERALVLEGATATLAADGQEAVGLLSAQPGGFDAVLMDVQMPVMDGLTATRVIRGELGLTALPVIALTAGVLAEELEAARAAGVNDVLAKPLDLEHMAARLSQWVRARPVALAAGGPSPGGRRVSSPQTAEAFPDIPGIDRTQAALTLNGDLSLFRRVLEGFVQEFAPVVGQTLSDLARGDRDTAARRMHTLRGNAGYLGALDLMAAAGSLEVDIEGGETGLDERLADLDAQLSALITASAPGRGLADPGPASDPGWSATASPPLEPGRLQTLRDALVRNNARARRLFTALEPALAAALGPETVQTLGVAIRGLRFREALAILDRSFAGLEETERPE